MACRIPIAEDAWLRLLEIDDTEELQALVERDRDRIAGSVGFHDLGAASIVTRFGRQPGNARSRAIPERLGYGREGILRQSELVGGRYLDGVLYAALAGEWPRSAPEAIGSA